MDLFCVYFFGLLSGTSFGEFQMSSALVGFLPLGIEGSGLLGFDFSLPISEVSMFCKVSFIDKRVDTTPMNKIYRAKRAKNTKKAEELSDKP